MASEFVKNIIGATKASVATARDQILAITGTVDKDTGKRIGGEDMTDPLNGFMLQEASAGLNSALGAGSALVKKNTDGNDNVIGNLR